MMLILCHLLFSSTLYLYPNILQISQSLLLTLHFWGLIIFLSRSRSFEAMSRVISYMLRQCLQGANYKVACSKDALSCVFGQFYFVLILTQLDKTRTLHLRGRQLQRWIFDRAPHTYLVVLLGIVDGHVNMYLRVINTLYRG